MHCVCISDGLNDPLFGAEFGCCVEAGSCLFKSELWISHGKLDDGNIECVLELLTCSGTENEWLEVVSVWFIGNIVCLDKVELHIQTVKELKDNLFDELLTGSNA